MHHFVTASHQLLSAVDQPLCLRDMPMRAEAGTALSPDGSLICMVSMALSRVQWAYASALLGETAIQLLDTHTAATVQQVSALSSIRQLSWQELTSACRSGWGHQPSWAGMLRSLSALSAFGAQTVRESCAACQLRGVAAFWFAQAQQAKEAPAGWSVLCVLPCHACMQADPCGVAGPAGARV